MATFIQATLHSGKSRLTAWVDKNVKVGNEITLKNSDEPDRLWRVINLSEPVESSKINRGWKVGGL